MAAGDVQLDQLGEDLRKAALLQLLLNSGISAAQAA